MHTVAPHLSISVFVMFTHRVTVKTSYPERMEGTVGGSLAFCLNSALGSLRPRARGDVDILRPVHSLCASELKVPGAEGKKVVWRCSSGLC